MSDLARAVAVVFRRRGTRALSKSEFKHAVSLDLRWFAPADAKKLLAKAVESGLVSEDGENVNLAFDPDAIEVPVTFRPTVRLLDEEVTPIPASAGPARSVQVQAPKGAEAAPTVEGGPVPPLLDRILAAAHAASGVPLADVAKEVADERERRGGLLAPEVCALLVARRRGVDIREYLDDVSAAVRGVETRA